MIKDGKILESQLRRLRISYEDLYSLLRAKDISDEKGVEYGIIEPNGTLSVLSKGEVSEDGIKSRDLRDELDSLSGAAAKEATV